MSLDTVNMPRHSHDLPMPCRNGAELSLRIDSPIDPGLPRGCEGIHEPFGFVRLQAPNPPRRGVDGKAGGA